MPVSLVIWRFLVGRFSGSKKFTYNNFIHHNSKRNNHCFLLIIILLLLLDGDVHPKPGPKKDHKYNLSVFSWNLNSITVDNFTKLSLISSYNAIYKYDMICLSETFLDSSFLPDDENLKLNGYDLIRSDHPNNVKRGGVCVFIKNTLPIKICNISTLNECVIIELNLNGKKCYVISLYRSPSQSIDEFDEFLLSLDQILHDISSLNPYFIMILGDFNAKSSSWYDQDITSSEGLRLESLTSFYNFSQLITVPTHILPNSASCIDLIFVDQPNIVMSSGVHSSLHPNCHHQIVFCKINLKITFPPPYERLVWDYRGAKIDLINAAISKFNWELHFEGKNVNEQLHLFNKTILNIFKNFIPNKVVTFDDSDLPWIDCQIKSLIKIKNEMFKLYLQNGKNHNDYIILQNANQQLSDLLKSNKKKYYDRLTAKLNNPSTSGKAYWAILKTFFKEKKIPSIPPIFINNHFVTDFLSKANIFNTFFSQQCTNIVTDSTVPSTPSFISDKKLNQIDFNIDTVIDIIRNLNPSKAHGHDGISIRMIQLSCKSIAKPLYLLFRNCFEASTFPIEWKKANVIPVYKKGNKQEISNYRPISLLPIFSKIFERIIFNNIFNYMDENKFFNPNQSGFRPGDSCVHQLISITHDIHKNFDMNPSREVRGLFLDISKAFDRVWHRGLLYKIKNFGIDGNFVKLIESFLSDRYQRVTINGQSSDWLPIKAGVPQGSILGPLLFLSYINDLPEGLHSNVKLFADDTAIFSSIDTPIETANELLQDLEKIKIWAIQWKMLFNPDQSKPINEVVFSKKKKIADHPDLFFNNIQIDRCENLKHLCLNLDEKLSFKQHIDEKIKKAMKIVGTIRKLSSVLPRSSLMTIYKSFVRPNLDYGDVIYDQPNNQSFSDKIESVQYDSALAITGAIRGTSRTKLYKELGLESLKDRRWMRRLCYFRKILTNQSPFYLFSYLPSRNISQRYPNTFNNFRCRTTAFQNSFFPYCVDQWNQLSSDIRNNTSYSAFRNAIFKQIRPLENSIFNIHDPFGIKLLTRLRLDFSHLKEHKFRHNFRDSLNPMCACSLEPENTSHFLLYCHRYDNLRQTLMSNLDVIDPSIPLMSDVRLVHLLLYGDKKYDLSTNQKILQITIKFLKDSLRFDEPLL